MPIVPVPAGKSQTWPYRPVSSWQLYQNDGKFISSGAENCGLNSFYMAGGRSSAKGKPTTLKGSKWSPCRPYWRYATLVDYVPGVTYLKYGTKHFEIWKGYPYPSSIFVPSDQLVAGVPGSYFSVDTNGIGTISPNAMARINTELLVKAGRRQVNWGESLGESKSTFRMLASSARDLARAVLAARRGNFGAVARALRKPRIKFPAGTSAASKWLAYQYGWKPLMGDIYDSYQHLVKGFDTRPQVLAVSRFLRETAVDNRRHNLKFTTWGARTEARLGAKLYFRVADSWLSRANQVGMINPAEVAWAVVPFSFVVDWFIPVGNLLEAMSARMSVDFVDGYYGITTNTVSFKTGCVNGGSFGVVISSSCSVRRETKGYRRTVMGGLPWPSPYFKSPFSTSHVTSAIALITQLLKR